MALWDLQGYLYPCESSKVQMEGGHSYNCTTYHREKKCDLVTSRNEKDF